MPIKQTIIQSINQPIKQPITRSVTRLKQSTQSDDHSIKQLINDMNQPKLIVPHIKQQYEWDCGIACAASVAEAFGINQSIDQLASLLPSKSVWTIDLAYLLHQIGLSVTLHTSCAHVNDAHRHDAYYAADIDADTERVNELYRHANERGVDVQEIEHDISYIADQLKQQRLVILLCDARFLSCPSCEETEQFALADFKGHFIVLTAVRDCGNVLIIDYVDPSAPCDACRMPGSFIDRARRQTGTDQDILIVGRLTTEPS